jgi:cytochrome b involved in lipid metabolism
LVVLALAAAFAFSACGQTAPTADSQPAAPSTGGVTVEPALPEDGMAQPGETAPSNTYALSEVALHAVEGDCWLAIEGKVYDVSSFTPRHPGGEAILRGCGRDASGIFNARHDDRAKSLLPDLYIGELVQ